MGKLEGGTPQHIGEDKRFGSIEFQPGAIR